MLVAITCELAASAHARRSSHRRGASKGVLGGSRISRPTRKPVSFPRSSSTGGRTMVVDCAPALCAWPTCSCRVRSRHRCRCARSCAWQMVPRSCPPERMRTSSSVHKHKCPVLRSSCIRWPWGSDNERASRSKFRTFASRRRHVFDFVPCFLRVLDSRMIVSVRQSARPIETAWSFRSRIDTPSRSCCRCVLSESLRGEQIARRPEIFLLSPWSNHNTLRRLRS